MKITVELGIPFRDFMELSKISLEMEEVITIKDVMEVFLSDHPDFANQADKKGYLIEGKLRAIYTKNKKLAPYEEKVNDGDVIGIIVPIAGG